VKNWSSPAMKRGKKIASTVNQDFTSEQLGNRYKL
jgi:hypothetical protein